MHLKRDEAYNFVDLKDDVIKKKLNLKNENELW